MIRVSAQPSMPIGDYGRENSWVAWLATPPWRGWGRLVALLLIGYLSMTRSFAYLGIPALKVFIGEVALAAFLLFHTKAVLGSWIAALVKPTPFGGVAWGLVLFLWYGVFELLWGLAWGHRPITVFQNLAFNYYPLYLFMGLWLGGHQPNFLPRIIRLLAWCNGLYGTAYILVLHRVQLPIPGSPGVPLIGAPGGSALALLGLLAFETNLARVWPLLLLNGFVLLGIQVRAEWLGLCVGLLLWAWITGRLRQLAAGGIAIVMLLAAMYVGDVHLPAPRGRSAGISIREIAGRGLAPLAPQFATQYTERVEAYAGTVSWRTKWWRAMWDSVHENQTRMLIGHGYGFPIGDLVPYLHGDEIRTPHNVFFYALVYGGWVGVAMFVVFQVALARLLWQTYRLTGQAFGLSCWLMGLTSACFSNFLETPFGAIPIYLLLGLALARGSVQPVGQHHSQKLAYATNTRLTA
jgi:O-Antigen ligase